MRTRAPIPPISSVPTAANSVNSNGPALVTFAACARNVGLHDHLSHALLILELQQQLIESQAASIKKLRIDLAMAREVRAIVLQTLDDVGALRTLLTQV